MMLPDDFKLQMNKLLGTEKANDLFAALSEPPVVSLRMNGAKLFGKFPFEDLITDKVAWCDSGFYLSQRPFFTLDPYLHAGGYYVQEASSMFLDHVLKAISAFNPMHQVLDMCAAPGGKSTILRSNMPSSSLLMANDPIPKRASVLAENLIKQGYTNNIVTCSRPSDYANSGLLFDLILCDAPCSGEGMFRKDADSIGEWSLQAVNRCQKLQREIVSEAWKCLKNEGILIYSTCTLNTLENEENVRWIINDLGGELVDIPIEAEWGITGSLLDGFVQPVYRFIPGKTQGEGLFMAVIRKIGKDHSATNNLAKTSKKKFKTNHAATKIDYKPYFLQPNNLAPTTLKNRIVVVDEQWVETVSMAQRMLRVLVAGIGFGQVKGKNIVFDHALALSNSLNRDAFFCQSLSKEEALTYLRREAIMPSVALPHGYAIVEYGGVPLGFIKNIGNRANNLYPNEWRIRTTTNDLTE